MQKRFIAAILLIITPLTFLYYLSNIKDVSQEQMVVNAFHSSQAKILTSVVRYKGELCDNNKDDEGLKKVMEKISTLFKIEPYSMEREENFSDTYSEHRISGQISDKNYLKIRAWSEYDQRFEQEKGYVEIELFCDGLWSHIDEVQNKIEQSLSTCVKKLQTTYHITGAYDGKLDDEELEEIYDRILQDSKAKEKHDSKMEKAINAFAYTPLYSGYTIPGSQEANLKLSIRYSPYENKTFISISSPIEVK